MSVSMDKTATLRAQMGGHPPIVYTLKIRGGCEGGGKGALIQKDKSATLGTSNDQYMFVPTRGGTYSVDEKMGNTYVWKEQANTLASRDYKQPQAVLVKKE